MRSLDGTIESLNPNSSTFHRAVEELRQVVSLRIGKETMADRAVRQTGKDRFGNITSLADRGQAWSPRASADCIRDIESRTHTYYVPWNSGRTEIRVVDGPGGKYLRTDRDNTSKNNLDDLPNP